MFRKTIIAVTAAAVVALGIGVASAGVGMRIDASNGYYQPATHYYGHKKQAPYHCHWKKVWKYDHWVTVKTCHRAWH